jgi:hypothetical protein
MGVPSDFQDDGAEDAHNLSDRILLILKRLAERPLILVVIMVAITLVLAIMFLSLLGKDPYYEDDKLPQTVYQIGDLQTFENTYTYQFALEEGREVDTPYSFRYALEMPDVNGEIVICLVDSLTITLRWVDEPDGGNPLVTYENQPDTIRADVTTNSGLFRRADEVANVHGQEGNLVLNWEGDGVYMAFSYRHQEGDINDVYVSGQAYVEFKGGDVRWDEFLTGDVLMTEAGDHTHNMLPVGQPDTGNDVTFEITLGGRYLSLAPGTYSDQSDR